MELLTYSYKEKRRKKKKKGHKKKKKKKKKGGNRREIAFTLGGNPRPDDDESFMHVRPTTEK